MTADVAFLTDDGQRVPAVTADEMREIDRIAVEDVGPELLQMMENAGRTLAGFARARTDGPIVVLAGDGGNGGGGLCAARHLSNHGREVRVEVDRPSAELTGAAATQHRTLRGTDATLGGVGVEGVDIDSASLVVDAVIGYGLAGAPRGRAVDLIDACNAAAVPVVSLDVPSGVDATTGNRPRQAVDADHVLTLALPKTGVVERASELWLVDIGIPRAVYERAGVDYTQPFDGEPYVRLRVV